MAACYHDAETRGKFVRSKVQHSCGYGAYVQHVATGGQDAPDHSLHEIGTRKATVPGHHHGACFLLQRHRADRLANLSCHPGIQRLVNDPPYIIGPENTRQQLDWRVF